MHSEWFNVMVDTHSAIVFFGGANALMACDASLRSLLSSVESSDIALPHIDAVFDIPMGEMELPPDVADGERHPTDLEVPPDVVDDATHSTEMELPPDIVDDARYPKRDAASTRCCCRRAFPHLALANAW